MTTGRLAGTRQFAAFAEVCPDAIIVVDGGNTIMLVNANAARLFGYEPADLIGKRVDRLLAGFPCDDETHEDTSGVDAADGQQSVKACQLLAHRKDGSEFPAELLITAIRHGRGYVAMGSVRDISERSEDAIRFRGVTETDDDAVVGVDKSGLIALVNPEAEELFGYARREMIDQPVDMLVPQLSRDAPDPRSARRAKRKPNAQVAKRTPLEGRGKDGSEFPVEISLSAVDTKEGPLVSASIRDASDRSEAQREQDRAEVQSARDLIESRLHQTHRLESLGQLAGGVAHDFNNLLAAILNYVAFVSEGISAEINTRPVGSSQRLTAVLSDISQIRRAAERAAALTHQLLAFARREVRHPEVLDINGIVRDVETLLRRTIGEHVQLITVGAPDLAAVRADRGQIEQILLNLAVNARDAMPNGGTVSVATENFTVDEAFATLHPVVEAGPYIRLCVTDTGTGMDRKTIDRAFEPFFSTKPKDKGTGLGLATVYGIVSQTGGMVELESEIGAGTTVTILLPSVVASLAEQPVAGPRMRLHRTGETILIVEDEELVRDVATRILAQHGYEVLVAASGDAATALIDGHPETIELLLTDVVMPGLTGRELAEQVSETRPEIRVLYMSGYPESVIASQGVLDQGISFVSKPFNAADLLEHVRAVLDA
jgi:PAS domain S-box-containing protein